MFDRIFLFQRLKARYSNKIWFDASSRVIYLYSFDELANRVIFGLPFSHTAEKFVCRISSQVSRE